MIYLLIYLLIFGPAILVWSVVLITEWRIERRMKRLGLKTIPQILRGE